MIRDRGKRVAARAVDAAIGAFTRLGGKREAAPAIPASPRVLVVRCDHIGDAVMATSVLTPLREALRPYVLDVLAGPWAASVFTQHPAVDHVLTYATPWWSAARGASRRERFARWTELPRIVRQIRAGRYDVGIDLRGDLRQIVFFLGLGRIPVRVSSDRTGGRSVLTHVWAHDASRHEVERDVAIAALLGVTGEPRLEMTADAASQDWLRAALPPEVVRRGYAVLSLTGTEENRSWPAEHAAAVVDALARELGIASVFIGTSSDAALGEEVARRAALPVILLAGRTSLPQATAVIEGAVVVIAVDSGPMHIAAAVGTPVVALFGPGDPRECRPWSSNAEVVTTGAPCGCLRARCDFISGSGRCMRAIEPAAVIDAVQRAVTRDNDPARR